MPPFVANSNSWCHRLLWYCIYMTMLNSLIEWRMVVVKWTPNDLLLRPAELSEVFNKLRWFVAVTLQWFWNKYANHLCWKYDTLEHASLLLCIFQMIVTRGASSLVSSNTNQNWFQNCWLLWPSLAWYCDTDQQLSHPRSVQFRIWQRQHESKVNMF